MQELHTDYDADTIATGFICQVCGQGWSETLNSADDPIAEVSKAEAAIRTEREAWDLVRALAGDASPRVAGARFENRLIATGWKRSYEIRSPHTRQAGLERRQGWMFSLDASPDATGRIMDPGTTFVHILDESDLPESWEAY